MNKKKTLIISAIIIGISILVLVFIFMTEPTAEREGATIKTAMLVDVERVNRGNFTPTVVATGIVEASKDITLSPQVGGEVVSISENFIPGSFVKKGEVLLQINPADYRNTLLLRQSDLQLAKADLSIEMGRQDVARKDLELVGADLPADSRDLVLRKPQLEAAKANVAAAEAAVSQARLNLHRSTIRAPFDAHVLSRNTNIGSQLAPGEVIGRLVGMDEYWIIANVPTSKVNWLTFGENDSDGAHVQINNKSWSEGQQRNGKLIRLVGALDAQTRLARVLISVPDPLSHLAKNDSIPPLMIGTFVETEIQAREIRDVVQLNRDYLRKNSTVWVMDDDDKLSIREVDIVFQDANYAYIREGLADNELVVITDLASVVEGSELRTEESTGTETDRQKM